MAILLALVSSLTWGTSDFLGGLLSKRIQSQVVVALSQSVGLIVVVVMALMTVSWTDPLGYIPWSIVASLSGASGLIVFYRGLAVGTMGIVAPIAGMAGVIPLVFGFLSGDSFTTLAAIGAIGIGAGVLLASGPEFSSKVGIVPVLYAMAAAILFGIAMVAIAQGSQYSPIMTMVGMRLTSVIILVTITAIWFRRSFASVDRRALIVIAITGTFDVSANLSFGIASQHGQLALVAVLGSLYPVVTAILAAIVLRERLKNVQYVGVAIAIAGLVTMIAAA